MPRWTVAAIRRAEDFALRFIQRRCDHPGEMVVADVLEGCADGIAVKYCRRCGSIKTDWMPQHRDGRFISLEHTWRRPDPYLWRGCVVAALMLLAACGLTPQPADPAVTARIVSACTASGLFKAVDGALSAAVPAAALPVMVVNAGVDIVCRDPARFAGDISTVEWVVRNLANRL